MHAFCYRKKKAQARRSSQCAGGVGIGGSEGGSAASDAQEMLMLLRRLAVSASIGAAGSVTQSSALTGSATASQSSIKGPPSTSASGTCP